MKNNLLTESILLHTIHINNKKIRWCYINDGIYIRFQDLVDLNIFPTFRTFPNGKKHNFTHPVYYMIHRNKNLHTSKYRYIHIDDIKKLLDGRANNYLWKFINTQENAQ